MSKMKNKKAKMQDVEADRARRAGGFQFFIFHFSF
jgi:hypothetical protein